MNCAFEKEKLTGYYDGELGAAEKAEVERHIASCSECLRELGELKSAALMVKDLPRLRAPRSIAEGVSSEIQAAGKVHVLAKFRRNVMWAAAAAAAILVGLNVMYFTQSKSESPAGDMALGKPAAKTPPIGRVQPRTLETAQSEKGNEPTLRSEPQRGGEQDRRLDEARKNVMPVEEKKKAEAKDEAARKESAPEVGTREKEKPAEAAKKADEQKPGVAAQGAPAPLPPPAPAAAKPAAPAADPARVPTERLVKEPPKPTEAPADKAAPKKDGDGLGKAEDLKRRTGAVDFAAEAGPTHLTLASTQIAKARPQIEEAFRKMGYVVPAPPPAMAMKAPVKSAQRESEATFVIELTDAQIARLRQELEKSGTSRLVTGSPDDPVLAQYKRDGMFGGKKEGAAVAGGAPAKKTFDSKADPKAESKEKDAKEAEESAATKVLAEGLLEKSVEPRRKVYLHLMEVQSLPDRPPVVESLKK